MSVQRFKNLKTLQDIKLEKARLRYEMLAAENQLLENFSAIERVFTITSYFRRVVAGYSYVRQISQNIYKYIDKFWGFWKKSNKEKPDDV